MLFFHIHYLIPVYSPTGFAVPIFLSEVYDQSRAHVQSPLPAFCTFRLYELPHHAWRNSRSCSGKRYYTSAEKKRSGFGKCRRGLVCINASFSITKFHDLWGFNDLATEGVQSITRDAHSYETSTRSEESKRNFSTRRPSSRSVVEYPITKVCEEPFKSCQVWCLLWVRKVLNTLDWGHRCFK